MDTARSTRTAATICIVVTGLAVLYAAAGALTGWDPSSGYLLQALIHLGELAGVVALILSGAAGTGLVARIALGAAVLGQVLLVVAELIYPGSPDLGDTLFGIGPVLSGLGLVVAGIVVIRQDRWTGPARFTPLLVGVFVLAVMTPVVIASDGPPAPAALWAIAGWDLCWMLLGLAAARTATLSRPQATTAHPA